MKKVVILGSTGQIGQQALAVISSYRREFRVVGLVCRHGGKEFEKQLKEFKPSVALVTERDGEAEMVALVKRKDVDLVVVAVVGMAGLMPTLAALKAGKSVALASKEVLVVAGELVLKEIKFSHQLIPLDSEPSAIFQSLAGQPPKFIKKIILTMGKGPIAKMTPEQLSKVTLKDIFNRPCWSMGLKISVDSATGINKAFEVIELAHLFKVKPEQIEIVVHPEYLCHSLVEFVDGSILTELGVPDMKRYLQYALFYPERKLTKVSNFVNLVGQQLTFEKPPYEKFPCLRLGFEVLQAGGTMPAVLHGADRAVVEKFISGEIRFTEIYSLIKATLKKHQVIKKPKLSDLIEAEDWGYKDVQKT